MASRSPVSKGWRTPVLLGIVLLLGAVLGLGGFSIYRDQQSGTPGTAKVAECSGGRKYNPGIRCTGSWMVGGDSLLDGGRIVVGRVEGAGFGDIGKTIDVRVHGTDHATKPALATPIVLWSMGGTIAALGLWGLVAWWRRD